MHSGSELRKSDLFSGIYTVPIDSFRRDNQECFLFQSN